MAAIQAAIIITLLGIEVYCDLKDRTIPNEITFAIAVAAFIDLHPENLWGLLPAALFFIGAVFTRIGGGDVKAVAALSLSLGLWKTLLLLFAAELSMLLFYGITAVVQKIRGRTASKALPFLPFITLGYILTIFV
ncbi:MAG: prepilin peptidase [Ruminiclostridium sp.]|nr:prepilin peptidase [Ruminiclostridium sp.]